MTALAAAARSLPRAGAGAVSAVGRWIPPRVLLVLLLAAPLLAGAWLWLRDSPLVSVDRVTVVGATGPDARAIRATIADAARGQSTLHVDPGALEASVSRFPLVRSLEVQAHPLHRLTVRVVSERPVAVLTGAGGRVAVTGEGKTLRGAPDGARLPAVSTPSEPVGGRVSRGRTLAALAVAAAAPPALRARLTKVTWGKRGLYAAVRRGPALIFGDPGRPVAKWAAAVRVLADPSSRGADYIDLRVPERPAAGGVAPAGQGTAETLDP